jgi:hypothetical protein
MMQDKATVLIRIQHNTSKQQLEMKNIQKYKNE